MSDRHQSTLHEWFEQQAALSPNAVAVSCGDVAVTYDELNRRANRLAHRLVDLGVGPDVLVGLCVERSMEAAVGLLGVLKAGGAYLPLDPLYPRERLAFMLEDARVPVIVAHAAVLGSLPECGAAVVTLDEDPAAFASGSEANPVRRSGPDNLAYVIYTSGSTGRPKGVMVTHWNVVRLMRETEPWYHFGSADVWTCFHSYSFDFSVWEIWGGLLYGGRVVMVPYETSRVPEGFYRLLEREGVTVLNQTPSAFKQLIAAEERIGVGNLSLRYVIFGGEALDPSSLKDWVARHGTERPCLVNMYGITETTVHVTYRPIGAGDFSARSVIGRPIPDLRMYILDEQLRPVPEGVPGEIFVGGDGVARGYLRRPELTAEKFLPDPFAGGAGARMYRTGDLARALPGGDYEYQGRIDDQVKIRGFRIELGEIENILREHPLVRDAAVVVREVGGDRQLAAFLIGREGQPPSASDLRGLLRSRLADYMMPAFYRFVTSFPLTVNGKIDRRSLLALEPVAEEAQPAAAPASVLEEQVARIWREVLSVPQVGRDDNFFEVGGTSLLILQVRERLQEALAVRVPVSVLFQYTTVKSLAAHLSDQAGPSGPPSSQTAHRAASQREALARMRRSGTRKPAG
jgi:amino acid adenylation domain-containing protein